MNNDGIIRENTCWICGTPVPEGRAVCPICEKLPWADRDGIEKVIKDDEVHLPKTSTREQVLDMAKQAVTRERNSEYGEPENNFRAITDYWNIYLIHKLKVNVKLEPKDTAIMMSLFKIGRAITSPGIKLDTFADAAGYLAIAAELEDK